MTRGLIIIKDGKTYRALRYSDGDSYISGEIGEMFATAFEAPTDEETVHAVERYVYAVEDEFAKECFETLESCGEAMYNKKIGGDQFYNDYAYVFDAKTCTLKIYYFGDLLFTFKKADKAYLRCLVEHDDEIWKAFSYDAKKREYGSYEVSAKKFRKYMRGHIPVDHILADVSNIQKDIHYVFEYGKCSDVWDNAYCRTVRFVDFTTEPMMKFIFKKGRCDKKWSVSMQLPWVRVGVIPSSVCNTEAAATKKLIAYLDKHYASLAAGVPLAELYGEYYQRLMKFYEGENIVTISEERFFDVTSSITQEFAKRANEYKDVHFDGYKGYFNIELANKEMKTWVERTYHHIFKAIQGKKSC